jgi:hypothetical protein
MSGASTTCAGLGAFPSATWERGSLNEEVFRLALRRPEVDGYHGRCVRLRGVGVEVEVIGVAGAGADLEAGEGLAGGVEEFDDPRGFLAGAWLLEAVLRGLHSLEFGFAPYLFQRSVGVDRPFVLHDSGQAGRGLVLFRTECLDRVGVFRGGVGGDGDDAAFAARAGVEEDEAPRFGLERGVGLRAGNAEEAGADFRSQAALGDLEGAERGELRGFLRRGESECATEGKKGAVQHSFVGKKCWS